MNKFEGAGFSATRRRILGGSAALAALSFVPMAGAAAAVPAASTRPAVWLAWHDAKRDRWRPVATACGGRSPDRAMRIVVRGPFVLSGSPNEHLSLEAVYRRLPDHPFHLGSGLRSRVQGGTVLHVEPTALAAIQVRQEGGPVRCELTNLLFRDLSPGRFVVLIDTDGNRHDPDWRGLTTSADGFPILAAGQRPMAAVTLDIRAA